MRAAKEQRIRWTTSQLAWACGLVCAAFVVTAPAWIDTFRLGWKDEEAGYVLIAPFVVAWLVWVRRARLAYCQPGGAWIGNLLILCGWLMWSYGYRKSAPTLWHGGPVLVVAGALVSVTGKDMLRKMLPAFGALLFLIPITPTRRQIIAAPLERYASTWTQAACELLGLHVAQHGNLLSVNGVNVEVAEACNGMRQVVTFWLVSYVIAFGQPLRWYIRLLMLAAVPVIAIGSNVARLVPTVWMYSYGATPTAHAFHDFAGWAMLVVAFACLYALVLLLRWALIPIQHFQTVAC
jgi:exosortase